MAFGLLVNKWRVLKSPLQVKFANVPKVVFSCMKLHNYCISERMLENEDFDIQNEVNEVRNSLRDRSMDFSYSASMEVDEAPSLAALAAGSILTNVGHDKGRGIASNFGMRRRGFLNWRLTTFFDKGGSSVVDDDEDDEDDMVIACWE